MSSTIVVGYIPSPEGTAAMNRAIAETKAFNAKLVVVNVAHDDGSTIDQRYLTDDQTAPIRKNLEEQGLDFQILSRSASNVAEGLLEVASEVNAQTIVIGLRRRSRVGKMILGSVAQRVLMDADCAVLAVRAEQS